MARPEAAKNAPLYLLFGAVDPTNPLMVETSTRPGPVRLWRLLPAKAIHGWRVGLGCPSNPTKPASTSGVHRNEWRDCAGRGALQAIWMEGLGGNGRARVLGHCQNG